MRMTCLSALMLFLPVSVLGQSAPQPPPFTDPGPLERQARRLAPFETLRPLQSTPPLAPQVTGIPGAEYRILIVLVVDQDGRVPETRLDYFETTADRSGPARSDVLFAASAAVERAIRQWRFEPPLNAPVKHSVGFRFTQDRGFEPWNVPNDVRFRLGPATPSSTSRR
jgi:hypothetical protein